jgi:uncharacterized protein (DUF488 family)
MSRLTLYTIGYEKRSFDEYVALLKDAGIGVVIDVRETAWSHKRGFSKVGMTASLAAAGMEYAHARFAGNPRRIRTEAKDHAGMLAGYRDHLAESPGIIGQLDDLVSGYANAGKRAALTCFERHPEDCHRGILAELWSEQRGGTVVHLGPEGCPRMVAAA